MTEYLPDAYTSFRATFPEVASAEEIHQVALAALTTAGFPATIAALGWIDEVLGG